MGIWEQIRNRTPYRLYANASLEGTLSKCDTGIAGMIMYVNKQNCSIWGTKNAHTYIKKSMHLKRTTVWCVFWSRGIIGSFFFKNEQGVAVTVDGDRYRAILNEIFIHKNWIAVTCHTIEAILYRLATLELWFDTLRLLFVGCRQR